MHYVGLAGTLTPTNPEALVILQKWSFCRLPAHSKFYSFFFFFSLQAALSSEAQVQFYV